MSNDIICRTRYVSRIFNELEKDLVTFVKYPEIKTNKGIWKVYINEYTALLILEVLPIYSMAWPNTTRNIRISLRLSKCGFLL